MTWRGRPVEIHQMNVDLIGKHHNDHRSDRQLRPGHRPLSDRNQVQDEDVDALPITRHDFHGE